MNENRAERIEELMEVLRNNGKQQDYVLKLMEENNLTALRDLTLEQLEAFIDKYQLK